MLAVVFILTAFSGLVVDQLLRRLVPAEVVGPVFRLIFTVAAACGAAVPFFLHHPAELVVYGFAGAGLAVALDALLLLLSAITVSVTVGKPGKR